jgi:hypothetical protein
MGERDLLHCWRQGGQGEIKVAIAIIKIMHERAGIEIRDRPIIKVVVRSRFCRV